jgi:hypothetical protein
MKANLSFVVLRNCQLILEEKMTYKLIESPIELTDDQLDMVAAAGGGLVDVDDVDIDIIDDVDVCVLCKDGDGPKKRY